MYTTMSKLDISVISKFLHYSCVLWRYASPVDSCILILTSAYALNFIIVILGPYSGCQGSLLGPYFIKSWVLIGSLFLSLEVPISFGNSATLVAGSKYVSRGRIGYIFAAWQKSSALPPNCPQFYLFYKKMWSFSPRVAWSVGLC